MKTFSQLNEESVDSLDKLGHKGKYNSKRLKKLARPYPAFEDFDLEEWQGYPPPKNSSTETHNELRYLMSLGSKRKVWKTEMTMYDKKVIKPFKDYLEDFGIEVEWDRIKELDYQRGSIILSLKRHYNRIRPAELAKEMSLPLDAFPLETADTPAYPSGHASSGRLISLLVADEAPLEHRKNILDIGQRIADSRMVAGAHYPSDTAFGKRIADELYRLSKNSSIEPDLTLESLKEMTLGTLQQTVADLSPDLDTVSNKKRIGNVGNISSQEFEKILKTDLGASSVKIIKPLSGKNESSAFDMFEFELDGDVYALHLAGKVAGRGTTATADNETSFLLVLSARQHGAKDDEESIKIKMIDSKVYSKVDGVTDKNAMSLVKYLEDNPSWMLSHRKQVNVLMQKIGTKIPKRYVKDDSKLEINKQARELYENNFNEKLNIDKWNPADVWLEYSSLPSHTSLTALNNYCFNSIKNVEGWIGISLKKGSGKLNYINYDKTKEPYELKNINMKLSKLWALSAAIEFEGTGLDGISLGFRIFNGKATEPIRGEGTAKGADAVQGKVNLGLLDTFTGSKLKSKITAVGGADILDYNRNTGLYSLSKTGIKKFKEIQKSWKIVKSNRKLSFARGAMKKNYDMAFKNEKQFIEMLNKEKLPENKGKAIVNSRFQTLKLVSLMSSMSQKDQKKLALALLKYGKSMSEWSAAHLKLE